MCGELIDQFPVRHFQSQNHAAATHVLIGGNALDAVERILRSNITISDQPIELLESLLLNLGTSHTPVFKVWVR